ncbi:MAG: hypothetical protein ACREU6_11765, partial [Steroidobacteraceae bacterium]
MRLDDPRRRVEITATHRLFALQAHAITGGEQSAQLDLRLPDVAPFAAFADQNVRGDALIKAQVTRDSKSTHLSADVNANIDAGAAIWAGLVRGGTTRLQVAGALTAEKVCIDRLQLTGRAVSLAASGSVARSATRDLDGRLEVSLSDLAQLSPTLAGTLKLSGKISGPGNALSTAAELTSTLSIRGSPKGTVSASVRAEGLPKSPRGTLEAHGDLDGGPLHLDVSLERGTGGMVHATIRRADWKSAHIDGDLTSGADAAQARANVRFRMSQLGDLDRLLGSTLQGSVAGGVALTPTSGHPRAQIHLEAQDVVAGGVTANAKLTAAGATDALDIRLDAQSPALGGEPASVTSTAVLNAAGHALRLASLEAQYHGQTVHLLAPATVFFADGLSIGELQLGAQQAVLEVAGRISPTLDVRVSLQQLKPELINAFVPGLLATGTIQATAQLQGNTAAPTGTLHLQASGVRAANPAARGLPALDLHADAQLMETTAL